MDPNALWDRGDGLLYRPVTADETLRRLRAPFTAEAVKWKLQSTWGDPPSGGVVVPYIDARLVVERLNLVVGFGWTASYSRTFAGMELKPGWLACELTIDGHSRVDVGYGGTGGQGDVTSHKAQVSDALKRAAVHFGIGVSVYAYPVTLMYAGGADPPRNKIRVKPGRGGKMVASLATENLGFLAEQYGEWLEGPGKQFGDAIDHGDAQGAVGDYDAERVPEPLDGPQEGAGEPARAVETDESRALRRDLLDNVKRLQVTAVLTAGEVARFHAMIGSAGNDIADLRVVREQLELATS